MSTIAEYLEKYDITKYKFAKQCNMPLSNIRNYILRGTIPNRKNMMKIIHATKGEVSANDFHNQFLPTTILNP
jgi:predicted transcriptional regulator